ncbi:hypothetical protein WJX79_005145 [Trebouxia sp. C0005]
MAMTQTQAVYTRESLRLALSSRGPGSSRRVTAADRLRQQALEGLVLPRSTNHPIYLQQHFSQRPSLGSHVRLQSPSPPLPLYLPCYCQDCELSAGSAKITWNAAVETKASSQLVTPVSVTASGLVQAVLLKAMSGTFAQETIHRKDGSLLLL